MTKPTNLCWASEIIETGKFHNELDESSFLSTRRVTRMPTMLKKQFFFTRLIFSIKFKPSYLLNIILVGIIVKEYLASTILRDLEVPFCDHLDWIAKISWLFPRWTACYFHWMVKKRSIKRSSTAPLESLLLSHALAFHYIILSEAGGGGVCYSADFSWQGPLGSWFPP